MQSIHLKIIFKKMIEGDLPYSLSVDNLWELPSRQDDTEREGRRVTYRGGIQHLCQVIKVPLIRCAESDAQLGLTL